jgi:hypothetical protein
VPPVQEFQPQGVTEEEYLMIRKLMLILAASLALTSSAMIESAFADSIAVTNYKRSADKIGEKWKKGMKDANDAMMKAKADLAELNKKNPRPADYATQVEGLESKISKALTDMESRSTEFRLEMALIEFKPEKNQSEGDGLREYIKKIIATGIPLSNSVSIPVPDVTWNWKTNTLGSIVFKINITPKGF